MKSVKFTTKKGLTRHKFVMSSEEFQGADDQSMGMCVACGDQEAYEVEPDANGYRCEVCGKKSVYGAQYLLMAGYIEIDENEDSDE